MTRILFVNGTLMRGLALSKNLEGAKFLGAFDTTPDYRLYSINEVHPGMFQVEDDGVSVSGELYEMSDDIWAQVEKGEPPHLYCGPVNLNDGQIVDGILFPRDIAEGHHKDISEFGGWRGYIASLS